MHPFVVAEQIVAFEQFHTVSVSQVHLLFCTTPSTVLYNTIYCSVQHHLMSCTTPHTVLYNTIYCPVQHHLLSCTTPPTVLYNTTEHAYLLTQISEFPTHMHAKLLKDRETRIKYGGSLCVHF